MQYAHSVALKLDYAKCIQYQVGVINRKLELQASDLKAQWFTLDEIRYTYQVKCSLIIWNWTVTMSSLVCRMFNYYSADLVLMILLTMDTECNWVFAVTQVSYNPDKKIVFRNLLPEEEQLILELATKHLLLESSTVTTATSTENW